MRAYSDLRCGRLWIGTTYPLTLGIAVGLFVGKQISVFVPLCLGIRAKWFQIPEGSNMLMLYGTTIATGIGFTMRFFIGSLAFEDMDPALASSIKLGVLGGSLLSLVFAIIILWLSTFKVQSNNQSPTTDTLRR